MYRYISSSTLRISFRKIHAQVPKHPKVQWVIQQDENVGSRNQQVAVYFPHKEVSLGWSFHHTKQPKGQLVYVITIPKTNTSKSYHNHLLEILVKNQLMLRDPCGVLVRFAVIRRCCLRNLSKSCKCQRAVNCCINRFFDHVVVAPNKERTQGL